MTLEAALGPEHTEWLRFHATRVGQDFRFGVPDRILQLLAVQDAVLARTTELGLPIEACLAVVAEPEPMPELVMRAVSLRRLDPPAVMAGDREWAWWRCVTCGAHGARGDAEKARAAVMTHRTEVHA